MPATSARTVADLGEDALVADILSRLSRPAQAVVPAGDDCAIVRNAAGWLQVLKTDAIVEGVHFEPSTPAEKTGRKAIARCLSDLAAMAAEPREALVTLAIPASTTLSWVRGFYRGAGRIAAHYGAAILGGETVSTPGHIVVSVAMAGRVRPTAYVTRRGGRAGDVLLVTGRLGGSIRGHHLDFTPRLAEAQWLAAHFKPRAMMDLSDGLATDLPRLAAASRTGWTLDQSALPRAKGCTIEQALCDGEDYELLIAIQPRKLARCLAAWRTAFPRVPLTVIGRLTQPRSGHKPFAHGGFDHFKKP